MKKNVRLMTAEEIAERQVRVTAAGYGQIDPERAWILDENGEDK